ncbi:hypothetical protein D3C72_2422470 [compost metagenome]
MALWAKALSVPSLTLTSPNAKPTGASLKVKVISAVSPIFSEAALLVIVSAGGCASIFANSTEPARPTLPARSV